jgi:hypothetical protein
MPRPRAQEELRQHTPEKLLLDTAQRLARFRAERRVLHVHLSRLRPYNRRGSHIRIAANTFENLVKQFDGSIFQLANGDLVFVCKGARVDALDEAVARLRYLFGEDPLAHEVNDETSGGFVTWYDLEHDYDRFLAAAQAIYGNDEREATRAAANAGEHAPAPADRPSIDARRLGELVDTLQGADLSSLLRRQPIAALLPGNEPHVVFRELYISIADLRDMVTPGYEIAGDRWLFQHLTNTLDRRMLNLLVRNDDGFLQSSFSININVATLLSPDFLEFDAGLRSGARGTILLELQLVDIFADLGAYVFAREFAKERGYRLCLDGVNHNTLPYVDRNRLGLDFVKISWRPEMADLDEARLGELRGLVEGLGRARAILCHVGSDDAVAFGHASGFALFQGRHIDELLGERDRRRGQHRKRQPR